MLELIVLLVILFAVLIGVWLTFQLVGVLVTLVVAAVIGWLADQIVPGKLPYGWAGAIVAGLLGSWLGSLVLGDLGPEVGGIALIPALLGAIVLAFAYDLLAKRTRGSRI